MLDLYLMMWLTYEQHLHAGTDGLALLLVADEDGAVYCTAGNRWEGWM